MKEGGSEKPISRRDSLKFLGSMVAYLTTKGNVNAKAKSEAVGQKSDVLNSLERWKTQELRLEREVTEYSKLLDSSNGLDQVRSIIQTFRSRDLPGGGQRPVIPARSQIPEQFRSNWYPANRTVYLGAKDPKGFPAIRWRAYEKKDKSVANPKDVPIHVSNAIRIGEDRVLLPQSYLAKIFGERVLNSPHNTTPIVERVQKLDARDSLAPIVSLPKMSDANISDGTYAVALGKYSGSADEEIVNSEGATGTNFLTGFLLNLNLEKNAKVKEAILNCFEHTTSKMVKGSDHENNGRLRENLGKSFAMIPDLDEWQELLERCRSGADGVGQPIYIKKGKEWEFVGAVHSLCFITESGEMPEQITQSSLFAPLMLIAGPDSLKEAVKQD